MLKALLLGYQMIAGGVKKWIAFRAKRNNNSMYRFKTCIKRYSARKHEELGNLRRNNKKTTKLCEK
jgi:hypothetical protein